MTDKKILDDWKEYVKAITESTGIDENEPEEQQKVRIARLEADPEAWFKYYFPRYAFAEPAPFHKAATLRVLNNPEHYEVRMWSRELAKSTRTMMEVLYLTLVGHPLTAHPALEVNENGDLSEVRQRRLKKYALIISNSLDNAVRLLMPYKANLEHNRRIIHDYGCQEYAGKWQAAEFTTEKGVSFRALGAGQSPRGTRNEEVRPDILIFDDVDTDADCLNPQLVAQKWRWIEEAAIGTRSVSQATTIIFCGNRIATDCCIERAAKFADVREIINIRDAKGRSSWPAKNTEADIDRVLRQKSYAATQKEYYNNPITEGAVFMQMAYKPARRICEYEDLVCYTDPSYKDTADYKATVLVGLWKDELHVIKCYLEQATTAAMLEWHKRMLLIVGKSRCAYYMEEVFMQDVILKEMRESCRRDGITIRIQGDKRRKPDKFTRIEALLEPLHRHGQLYFNANERDNPHMMRLVEQFTAFAPGSNAHDDGPDAVEGAVWLLATKTNRAQRDDIKTWRSPGKRNNKL